MTLYQPYRASAPYREPRALHPRKLWPLLLAILLWPAAGARAQAGGNAAPAAPAKIAVLNFKQAIVTTGEGKQASALLQSQFAAQQNDLQNMQKQIQDLQSRLSNGARTLSEDEQGRLQRQGELLARQFQRKQDDLNEAVNAAQSDIIDNIGRKMLDVLDRHARESGYTVVLDTSAQGSPVLYGSSQIDITPEVIRLYDQAYPVKTTAAPSSSPAAPAAQPKPAGGTPPPAAPKKTP
jgi:outer membrane protein